MSYPNFRPCDGFFALADTLLTPVFRVATRAAVAAARALHRAYCVRAETRAASAIGLPSPADIRAVWAPPRRSLRQALLVGSRLVDLSAAHSDRRRWSEPDAHGRRKITGREGGLKRYFAKNLPDLPYATAMRYRQLALRVLRVLDTPAALPLEWLMSAVPADNLTPDPALVDALRAGRRKLAELLADVRTQRDLTRKLDRRPDSDRLVFSPRGKDSAQLAAIRDEVLRRGEEKLAAAVAGGRPLTAAEKRALVLLKRLRGLEKLLERFAKPGGRDMGGN